MVEPFEKPIYVTRPFLPPLADFTQGLQEIWSSEWLTNNGPVLQRFQKELCDYFNTSNVCLFNNGTLALQIALQGLQVSGEVITTPFTFVATTHALYWNKIRPVFVDIEPGHYTLDPARVEEAITPWTSAILAVHVYGYPCRLRELAEIARRHKLLLLYDAAHAFGVTVDGYSIGNYGDLSMFSFHATKLFHSIEGGMLMFSDPGQMKVFDYLKNFGFDGETEVVMPGTNAKMNEFQALMGLQVLGHMGGIISRRQQVDSVYRSRLKEVPGIHIPELPSGNVKFNHAYFPVEIDPERFGMDRDQLYTALKKYNVFTRRYFYPLVTDFACYRSLSVKDPLTKARQIAKRILTLPIYDSLELKDVNRICDLIAHICPSLVQAKSNSWPRSTNVVPPGQPVAL
ncbi:MAG TPA: DegT/DnrJ/EryC1/StrS family aminotransferase [Candidatus Saccharimonadales bacterium]|nr:DegT/DnrJ/EryC1/StrS family aminotransferase [Candidatus Saccharimonadales bacterium]